MTITTDMFNDYRWWDAVLSPPNRKDFWLTLSNEMMVNQTGEPEEPVYYDPSLRVAKRKANRFLYDKYLSSLDEISFVISEYSTDDNLTAFNKMLNDKVTYESMLLVQYSSKEEYQELLDAVNSVSSIRERAEIIMATAREYKIKHGIE